MKTEISKILSRNDAMDMTEASFIAIAINEGEIAEINQFLKDLILFDGTNVESKLAAILRGLLLPSGETKMSDLNDAVTLAESAMIAWACEAAGIGPDELVDDQDRADLHTLLMAFGKVCQTTGPARD